MTLLNDIFFNLKNQDLQVKQVRFQKLHVPYHKSVSEFSVMNIGCFILNNDTFTLYIFLADFNRLINLSNNTNSYF